MGIKGFLKNGRGICQVIIVALAAVILTMAGSEFVLRLQEAGQEKTATVNVVSAFVSREFVSSFSEVEVTAKLGDEYFDENEKKNFLLKIAEILGISNHSEYTCSRKDDIVVSGFETEGEESQVYFEFISQESEKSSNVLEIKQYVKVRIGISDSVESLFYYREKLVSFFEDENLNITSKINVCGEVEGILSSAEKENMAEQFIDKLSGNVVSFDIGSENFAVYGYTKHFDDYIVYGDKKVNLTLVIQEDKDRKVTSVYMATPNV